MDLSSQYQWRHKDLHAAVTPFCLTFRWPCIMINSYNKTSEQDQEGTPSWSCSQAVRKPVWHVPLLFVQWKTPDDGQRNCSKHAEFYSKNKFEELVHLVGFIVRRTPFCVSVSHLFSSTTTKRTVNCHKSVSDIPSNTAKCFLRLYYIRLD